jgi:tetratricopeptide (TPR) repeat protein
MAIDDPNVEIMSSRDCDSRISLREKVAMEEWIKSKFPFHIMRDHPDHTHPVMTGMFDTRKLPNINWETKIRDYKSNEEYHHFYDMEFVRDEIYPYIKNNSLVHDSFYSIEPNTRRFPTPYDKTFFHIGGYMDEKESPSVSHVNGLMSRYVSKYGIINRPLQSKEEWVDQMVCFLACSNLKETRYLEPLFSIIQSFPFDEMKGEYSELYSNVCLEYYTECTSEARRGLDILRESLRWNSKNNSAYEIFSTLISQKCLLCKTPQESIALLRECIVYKTNDIVIHYDLGYFSKMAGDTYTAILHLNIVLDLLSSQVLNAFLSQIKLRSLNLLGIIFQKSNPQMALMYFQSAYELFPSDPDICNHLGTMYLNSDKSDVSLELFETALQHIDERIITQDKNLLLSGIHNNMGIALCSNGYDGTSSLKASFETNPTYSTWRQYMYQCRYIDKNSISMVSQAKNFFPNKASIESLSRREKGERLTIGFLTGKFTEISVPQFTDHLMLNLSRNFNVIIYSRVGEYNLSDSVKSKSIESMSVSDAVDMIRRDKIDILIDLIGHTSDKNNFGILSHKPAPIQISYCGDCASSGLSFMDYHITDSCCNSTETQKYYSEKLLFMPKSFLCFSPAVKMDQMGGTRKGGFCFGTTTKILKLNSQVISIWSSILEQCPLAHLVIKGSKNILNLFPESVRNRIISIPRFSTQKDYMNCYTLFDVTLDTFPYSGTTTTCESLYMGVPVITLKDASGIHHHNVSASILENSGMSEGITYSEEQYIQRAKEVYTSFMTHKSCPWTRQEVHDKFRTGYVMNTSQFSHDMTLLLEKTYREHC